MTTAVAPRRRARADEYAYTLGDDVIAWTERHCVYPRGPLRGKPRRWLPWQEAWIRELYRCNDAGDLRYRWALLGIPKKNDKTSMLATLAVHHVFGDPYQNDPWAVIAATSDKQADILFNDAKTICDLSPTLHDASLRFRWEIKPKDGPGKIERVAASKGKLDGKDCTWLALDELHEWDEENWNILTNGIVGRHRAQIIQITTAGFDLDTICGREYEKGRRIEAGEVKNPRYFFRWYGAPEDADYRDEKVWEAANPSYGVIVTRDTLQDQLDKAQHPAVFKRYNLNIWTSAASEWLSPGAWERTEGRAVLKRGLPTWAGWDASTKRDTTALVAIQWQGEGDDRRLVIVARLWERPLLPDGRFDEDWKLPIGDVERAVRGLAELTDLQAVAYDPAFITWSADELESAGLPMVEWPQSSNARMVPATQATYELIELGEVVHDDDPRLARHIANVQAYQTREGGQRIGKGKQRKAIDFAIALVMAVGAMNRSDDDDRDPEFWTPGEKGAD